MNYTRSYQHFWPHFMEVHEHPWTRRLHVAATVAGLFCILVKFPLTLNGAWLVLAPVVAYPIAWFSHLTFERNKPAAWRHPYWSFLGDLDMTAMILMGTLDAEVARLKDRPDELFTPRRHKLHRAREAGLLACVLATLSLWLCGFVTFSSPFGG